MPNNSNRNYKSEYFIPELFGDVPGNEVLAFIVKGTIMPKYNTCPKCGSLNSMIKHGKTKNGTQRYKCKSCLKTYILNESPTKYLQNSDYTLRRFIGLMIDDVALDVIARNLKMNIKTAHYYRYLVFHSLKNYQEEVKLSGKILIDETFMRIQESQYKLYRLDGKGIRGLSFNQLCIITLIDLTGICVAKISSRAMALPDDYKRLFNHNIKAVKLFIHDGNPKSYQFMNQFNCDKVDARRDCSGNYSTDLIDSLHRNIKRYLFKHAGYRLKNLQYYLDFFVYRHNHLLSKKPKNKREELIAKNRMIDELFLKILSNKKSITYKTYLNDEGITDVLESHM
jgi:transposase-like protein